MSQTLECAFKLSLNRHRVSIVYKKNVLIVINEHRKINLQLNLKVFELFLLKIEHRDEKVRGNSAG